MAAPGRPLWLMLLKDVGHLCLLKACSVSAARNMGILLPIVLRNSALIAKRRVTLSKIVVFPLDSLGPRISDFGCFPSRHNFCNPRLSFRCLSLLVISRPIIAPRLNGTTNANFGTICNGVPSSLPIAAVGDASSKFTDVFLAP
ncbi:hypothetical protein J5N97_018428 [Dioscorea zingiberensis]|uniref:Secreted protein n=1 Tax=Dioscorea zingiberensis TaxID=325984 RepID=A0A9D5CQH8_9LILI|nr:hypothetical protein J5N97_018428 [Dioscorea zingiberensis]